MTIHPFECSCDRCARQRAQDLKVLDLLMPAELYAHVEAPDFIEPDLNNEEWRALLTEGRS